MLQIHALHNMLEAYRLEIAQSEENAENLDNSLCPQSLELQQNIDKYTNQSNIMEWKYLEAYASRLNAEKLATQQIWNTYSEQNHNLLTDFFDLAEFIASSHEDLHVPLINKIHGELQGQSEKISEMNSINGCSYILVSWYRKVNKLVKSIKSSLLELDFFTSNVKSRNQMPESVWTNINQFVQSCFDCHLSVIRVGMEF